MKQVILTVPDNDPDAPEAYPGNIRPGRYTKNELVRLLRDHSDNQEAVRFIADMLEE